MIARYLLLQLLALSVIVIAVNAAPTPPKSAPAKPEAIAIDGIYFATGADVEKNKYRNVVVIRKHGHFYVVQWMGGTNGIGLREDNILTVGYTTARGFVGTGRYRIAVDAKGKPTLAGRWVISAADSEPGEEVLTYLRSMEDEK
jgi:hypothetical protein